jgi:predicted enzyme related to lactoylglutathione lyase
MRATVGYEKRMPLRTRKNWWGVTLDAPDGAALGRFYAELLGWQYFPGDGGGASVAPSADAGYNLGFQTEQQFVRPVWPAAPGRPQMSMHLEIEVDDLTEAVAYARAVGAVEADFQPQPNVRVMLDPAGHPFCLYLDD